MKPDADGIELLDSVERGERQSAGGGKRERTRYARYAKATFREDRRLNTLAEELPYQTLISSLLHKCASGRLKGLKTATGLRFTRNRPGLTTKMPL